MCGNQPLNSRDENARGGRLGNQGFDAQQLRSRESFRRIIDGEEYDLRVRRHPPDGVSCLHSIHFGHADIQKDDIGLERAYFFDGLLAVLRFPANHRHVPAHVVNNGACRSPRGRMIVYNQNSGGYVQIRIPMGRLYGGYPKGGCLRRRRFLVSVVRMSVRIGPYNREITLKSVAGLTDVDSAHLCS